MSATESGLGPATASGLGPLPAGGPAPTLTRVLAQARFELGTLLRNGEQLLVALVLPLGALVGLALSTSPSLGSGRRIDLAVPGILALCVISAAFTSQAISTAFDRRYAVLRLLGTTPVGRDGLLWAKALATIAVEVLQWVVLGVVGVVLGWHPAAASWFPALLFLLAGTWAFVALALLLAGTLRAEGVLAVANLLWILLLGLGGVIVPRSELPAGLAHVAAVLPSSALADGLRTAFVDGQVAGIPLLLLVIWGGVATLLARRTFRWSD
ncbi:ABC transporter permease [Lapillicoccus sp.]|jgi:ABC-2 type transport system permease protein|uniref:ABC transporter permease n=1 Tax=Lapillicoccus sp. TaxID=1909287 RepID=UPI0025E8EDD0|nr:ABC transporter permease [Lapillicoccus sp.]